MKIGRLEISASRWPWMIDRDEGRKYGWGRTPVWGRFGGGWHWKLGVEFGTRTVLLNLLYGIVSVRLARKAKAATAAVITDATVLAKLPKSSWSLHWRGGWLFRYSTRRISGAFLTCRGANFKLYYVGPWEITRPMPWLAGPARQLHPEAFQ